MCSEAVVIGAENVIPSASPRGMIDTLRIGSAPGEHADERMARFVGMGWYGRSRSRHIIIFRSAPSRSSRAPAKSRN